MNFQDIPEKCPICYKKLLQEKRGDDTIYHYCENKCFSGCLVGYSEDLNKIFPTCLSCGNIITSHLYHYSHGGKVWIELGHCGCWYERCVLKSNNKEDCIKEIWHNIMTPTKVYGIIETVKR